LKTDPAPMGMQGEQRHWTSKFWGTIIIVIYY
jgi:hypothetical protein